MTTTRIAQLVRRMEKAPDFGYDDEAVELNRLLAARGETWRWSGSPDRVVIEPLRVSLYKPACRLCRQHAARTGRLTCGTC